MLVSLCTQSMFLRAFSDHPDYDQASLAEVANQWTAIIPSQTVSVAQILKFCAKWYVDQCCPFSFCSIPTHAWLSFLLDCGQL